MSENCCDYGCNQGRNCPVRARQDAHYDVYNMAVYDARHNDTAPVVDGLPVAMFVTPLQRLGDLFLDVVWWTGTVTLIFIVLTALFFATGLYRIF